MPLDNHDDAQSSKEKEKQEVREALQSETDKPLPPAAERIAERDADRPNPVTPQGQRRRYLTRRNAFLATLAIGVLLVGLALVLLLAYKLGYIDRYVAGQIKDTLAQYGIRAEIKEFHTAFGPRTVEMRDIELYDAQTGAHLGKVGRLLATVRIEDLYSIKFQRNVNLEKLEIDNLEAWVEFDEQGHSNFRNIHLPPPEPNKRILFSYATAFIKLNSAVIHYGDEEHKLSGEARNIRGTIQPDDLNAPAESAMNRFDLWLSNSTFVYDGRPVNGIDIEAHGRLNQTLAEIHDLTLRSPVAEAHLQGTMDDWRAMRYRLNITSMVDLTQASDVLQAGATLRGTGNFSGTVSGEGSKYQVEGNIKSDALAADNLRLKALNVNASGTGDGKSYNMNGKAVAELLTVGDFQLNAIQLAGNVMGTGTDFRWLGELRAAALRSGGLSIAGLILSDVAAEMRDEEFSASAPRGRAASLRVAGANVSGVETNDLRVKSENGVTTASASSAQAGTVTSSGTRVNKVSASGINVVSKNEVTNVTADRVQVGGVSASGAQIASINVAGVRLSVHGGRLEGATDDFSVPSVVFGENKAENIRVARPVFLVEPSGRYRASADLSLGGGVLGQMPLGAARAGVVATNSEIQFNNFNADLLGGSAKGNATLSMTRGGASRVAADFSNIEIGNLITALSNGRVVPVSGKATGNANLTFPGTNFNAASGNLRAEFNGETGNEAQGRTPLTGTVALRADRGLFNIEEATLRTPASELKATGQFSFERDESNLQLDLSSTDAAELQNVLVSTGLLPSVAEQLETYGIGLGGKLAFNGTVRGKLKEPEVDGRASVDSLMVKGHDVGSLSASIKSTPDELNVTDGRLTERDGGGAQFSLNIPFKGTSNTSLDATLDRVNGETLVAVLSGLSSSGKDAKSLSGLSSVRLRSDLSGTIKVTGIPDAMNGIADLRFGKGDINGEPFETITARATFNGPKINLEDVNAQFLAGRITASGTYDTTNQAFDLQAKGQAIQLERLTAFAGNRTTLPQLTGTADLEARASGIFTDFSTYQINFNGEGHDVIVNGRPAGTLTLTGKTENKQLDIQFTTGLLGQPQVLSARVDLGNDKLPTTIETTFNAANLQPLLATLLPKANVKVTGTATGTIRASGNLINENEKGEDVFSFDALRGTANFSDLSLQIEDVPLKASSPLLVQFSRNEIFFEKTQFTGPGTNIIFGGTAAIGPTGRQALSVDGQINLRVLERSISPDVFLSGPGEVSVRVAGTYEAPRLSGRACIGLTGKSCENLADTSGVAPASISMLVGEERLTLSNVKGRVFFNENQAQIDTLTGTLGGGRASASGGVLLAGFTPSRFRLSVHGEDVVVPYPVDFRTTADADLEINGTTEAQIISGTVNLRRSEYTQDIELADLINRRREASLTEGTESTLAATTQLDLRVEGRDALVVRNNLADLVGSVSLRVTGPLEDPVISGRITASRGTLSFRNDRYEVTRAFIDLPGRRDADPILNIQAESEIKGYRVMVGLTGPLSQPQANVRSDPALPQADVVSLITTGSLASGDTSTSALAQTGLGTAASLLTDTLINAPAQRATSKLFGLSRFEIDPLIGGRGGSSPTARLTIGRQITKEVSITYSTNVGADPNQVLALEYRVSNRLSFVAQYEQGSTRTLNTHNDNFSFEIRFRKRF